MIAQNTLLILPAFLGLCATVGGSALIISPSGKLLGGLLLCILLSLTLLIQGISY